jgi:hypothetical protein
VVKVDKGGYDEPIAIPKAGTAIIDITVQTAVRQGHLWLTAGPASLLGEEIPAGVLNGAATLQAPPEAIPAFQLLPQNLPEAWKGEESTALAMAAALSQKGGKTLPWWTVKQAIDGAFRAQLLEKVVDMGQWPCDFAAAGTVKIRVPKAEFSGAKGGEKKYGARSVSSELRGNEIQDLSDAVGELTEAAAGHDLRFFVRVELGGDNTPPEDVVRAVNKVLTKLSVDLNLE